MKTSYLAQVWDARYFWTYLAIADLNARWRRSFFGILWTIMQPLGMTLLLSLVFSKLFHVDITKYAPYIFSGVIIWEFIVFVCTGGSLTFVQSAPYIKQCKHPLAIYSLRTVITGTIVLLLASIPLVFWVLLAIPETFSLSWISIITLYPIVIMIAWPLATILAYVGTRFRDLTPALALMLQALWFISPVYFEEKMFRAGGLNWLVDYNPIYHVLQIIRAPLLTGQFPTFTNYAFCLGTAAIVTLLAILIGLRSERKVIFYL